MSTTHRPWKALASFFVIIACIAGWLWVVDHFDLLVVKSGTPMRLPAQDGAAPVAPGAPGAPKRYQTPSASVGIPGLTASRLLRPDQIQLADDEQVIGVTVDGESRAYVVSSFEINGIQRVEDISAHLVNDVIAGRPICVTHCDRSHSTRVLTLARNKSESSVPETRAQDPSVQESSAKETPTPESSATKSLDVRIGGWQESMVLVVDGSRYPHHSPDIPLADVQFTTTTWGKWRAEHPETLVYVRETGPST